MADLFKMVDGRKVKMTVDEAADFLASQEPAGKPRPPARDRLEEVVETLIANVPALGPVAADLRAKVRGK